MGPGLLFKCITAACGLHFNLLLISVIQLQRRAAISDFQNYINMLSNTKESLTVCALPVNNIK